MEIRGFAEFLMLKNIHDRLRHGERYNKYQVAKASGNKNYFYSKKCNMMHKLLLNGVFIEKSNPKQPFEFDRIKLNDFLTKFNTKVPFRW